MNKFILCLLLFALTSLKSFSGTGSIEGRVMDDQNSAIMGAIVRVTGTALGASSDMDGKFHIKNIPAGTYTIEVSFISYDKKVISDVVVKDNGIQTLTVSLSKSSKGLGEVTVKATLKKENMNALLVQQKNLSTISNGISAETIRRSPDRSSADVLKRISGVSVVEGKFVVVRGLADRYNLATLNGSILPSSESDRKAFSFDMFPSNMLDQIVIVKAATPDMPAEFAGAAIQLVTKDIPNDNFLQIQLGTGVNTLGTFKSYYDTKNSKTDWLGYDNKERALPSSFPTTDSFYSNTYSNNSKYEASKTLSNPWGIEPVKSMMPARNLQISAGASKSLRKETRIGMIASFSYNRNRRLQYVERNEFELGSVPTAKFNDTVSRDNVLMGALFNIGVKLNAKNQLFWRNMFSINGEDQTVLREGFSDITNQQIRANSATFSSNRLLGSQLSGEHILTKRKIKLQWNTTLQDIHRVVPDSRRMFYVLDDGDSVWKAVVPINRGSAIYAGRFFSDLNEKNKAARLDLTIPFTVTGVGQSIKVGAYYQRKDRTFTSRVLGYAISNAVKFNYDLLTQSQSTMFESSNMGDKGFRIDDVTEPSNDYTAGSSLTAAYLMADNKVLKKFRLVYGVRLEHFEQNLESHITKTEPYSVKKSDVDVLPSMNLMYALNSKTNLRFCASKTLSRPEFRELARFTYYDFTTNSVMLGNEDLTQTTIQNYDVKYEIFPGKGEMLSASLFYKRFDSPIEQYVKSFRDRSFKNAGIANTYGVELEGVKKFSFLTSNESSWWNYLSVFGNVAFMKSRVEFKDEEAKTNKARPMQGQSPYLINGGLSLIHPDYGMGLSLLYNRIGERLVEVGTIQVPYPDVYEKSRDVIDIVLSKTFYKKIDVKLSCGDILHPAYVFYQNDDFSGKYTSKSNIISKTKVGANYAISFSWKL